MNDDIAGLLATVGAVEMKRRLRALRRADVGNHVDGLFRSPASVPIVDAFTHR